MSLRVRGQRAAFDGETRTAGVDAGGRAARRARLVGCATYSGAHMLQGRLLALACDSRVLLENPLGDPAQRGLPVYLPPGVEPRSLAPPRTPAERAARVPLVLVLAGYTGTGESLLRGTPWEPSFPNRYEALLADGRAAPCAFAFPDAFTRLGGSQYMNSPATGRYEDHLIDELLPLVESACGVGGTRERRGLMGRSSGGYGALHLALQHPDRFSALASHSGDCGFDLCYRPDFGKLAAALDRAGGVAAFLREFESAPRRSGAQIAAMNILAMASAYSPDSDADLGIALPFDPRTGALRDDVWQRWLTFDPVTRAAAYGEVLAAFRLVYLDAGTRDEYHLQFGARQLADALRARDVPVHHEEYDDGHMGTAYRYDVSLPLITKALSA
jgi:S-formylglutathione hydrolase FrmB